MLARRNSQGVPRIAEAEIGARTIDAATFSSTRVFQTLIFIYHQAGKEDQQSPPSACSPCQPRSAAVGRASAELPEDLPPMARRTEWAAKAQKAEQSKPQLPTYQCSGGGWGPRCNQGGTSSYIPLGSEHKHQLHRKGVRRHSHGPLQRESVGLGAAPKGCME